jgi:hypothetical protein
MTDSLRVFVDARPVDVPRGATAIDAVRAHDPEMAEAVLAGRRTIMDSRGLPVDDAEPLAAGAIFRTVARRERAAPRDDEHED